MCSHFLFFSSFILYFNFWIFNMKFFFLLFSSLLSLTILFFSFYFIVKYQIFLSAFILLLIPEYLILFRVLSSHNEAILICAFSKIYTSFVFSSSSIFLEFLIIIFLSSYIYIFAFHLANLFILQSTYIFGLFIFVSIWLIFFWSFYIVLRHNFLFFSCFSFFHFFF